MPVDWRVRYIERFLVIVILLFVAALPIYHDITRNFLANSDMDVVLAYYAILVASDLPLEHFPHTAYLHVLIYGAVIWLADAFGWIATSQLDVISKSDKFEPYFSEIIVVGRALSIFLSVASAAIVWRIAKLLTANRWAALCALTLFAGSLGLGDQSSVIRTELPSMFFVLLGFWMLIIASQAIEWRTIVYIGFAAFFAYAALLVKVQAVFIVLFFPLLGLALANPDKDAFRMPKIKPVVTIILLSIVLVTPAAVGLLSQLPDNRYGIYQAIIMTYVFVAVVIYTRWRQISFVWAIIGIAGLLIGLAAGEYLNLIKETWTGFAIFNFLEALSEYGSNEGAGSTSENIFSLPGHFLAFISRYLIVQQEITKTYPFLLVFWTAIAGFAVMSFKRQWRLVGIVGVLLLMSFALPTVFSIRGYLYQYRIYAEIWTILAAVIVLAQFSNQKRCSTYAHMAMLFLCFAVSGVTVGYDLIKHAAANTREPVIVCPMIGHTPRIAHNLQPYCDKARRERADRDLFD
jgi:hypothetical protein